MGVIFMSGNFCPNTKGGHIMPRRNNMKKEPFTHRATIYDKNFNPKCLGCAFAGHDFICRTSDGQCLKLPPAPKDSDHAVK
jgi:hypothetical protein